MQNSQGMLCSRLGGIPGHHSPSHGLQEESALAHSQLQPGGSIVLLSHLLILPPVGANPQGSCGTKEAPPATGTGCTSTSPVLWPLYSASGRTLHIYMHTPPHYNQHPSHQKSLSPTSTAHPSHPLATAALAHPSPLHPHSHGEPSAPQSDGQGLRVPFLQLPDGQLDLRINRNLQAIVQPKELKGKLVVFAPCALTSLLQPSLPGMPAALSPPVPLHPQDPIIWSWLKNPKPTTFVLFSTLSFKMSCCQQADNKSSLGVTTGDSPVPPQLSRNQPASSLPG